MTNKQLAQTLPGLIDSWFGDTARAAVSLAGGDWVQGMARINRERVARKLKEKLEERQLHQPKPISPRVLIPALEALSEESDDSLQDIWANLLANALDPEKDVDLQKILVETLRQFEPIDAALLHEIDVIEQSTNSTGNLDEIAIKLGVRPMALALSHERLGRLGCVQVHVSRFAGKLPTAMDGEREYRAIGQRPLFKVTALGFELLRAVRSE